LFDIFESPDFILTPDKWSRTIHKRSRGKKEIVFLYKKEAFTAITFYQTSPFYEVVTLENKCPYRLPLPRNVEEFESDLQRCKAS
jgi:hypothetical protein